MHEYSHSHPLPDGRAFQHTHALPAEQLEQATAASADLAGRSHVAAALEREHAAQPLARAHPDLRSVAEAPAPGSPADLRQQAASLREQADWHRREWLRLETIARSLDARAAQDEEHPPSEQERIRRLFE